MADDNTVTTPFITDGIIDSTGLMADFQTFYFQGWTDLTRMEIPTYGWSLDNVVVGGVPEPSAFALVLLGGGLLWFLHNRERKRVLNLTAQVFVASSFSIIRRSLRRAMF